jgi:hypothetical protein
MTLKNCPQWQRPHMAVLGHDCLRMRQALAFPLFAQLKQTSAQTMGSWHERLSMLNKSGAVRGEVPHNQCFTL